MKKADRLRAEMSTLYGRMCDAALQLDVVQEAAAALDDQLIVARRAALEAKEAMIRGKSGRHVSLAAFRAQKDAVLVAESTVATIEGWLAGRRKEAATVRDRHNRYEAEYQRLNKELDDPGATVIEFLGHPHADKR